MKIPIMISYDNASAIDGFGAQAIRLTGILSIASLFHCYYLHTPILEVPREELSRHAISNQEYEDYLSFFNGILDFSPEVQFSTEKFIDIQKIKSIWLSRFLFLVIRSSFRKKHIHLQITQPQGITDKFPFIFELAAKRIRKNVKSFVSIHSGVDVVIHIRAEHHGPNKRRPHLSALYYEKCIEALLTSRSINPESRIIVHTDFYAEDFETERLAWRPALFDPWFRKLKNTFSNLEVRHYAPLDEMLSDMFRARILIMSRSSISYFAGIVNSNLVIWPPSHGHAKMPRWRKGPHLPENGLFIGGMKSIGED